LATTPASVLELLLQNASLLKTDPVFSDTASANTEGAAESREKLPHREKFHKRFFNKYGRPGRCLISGKPGHSIPDLRKCLSCWLTGFYNLVQAIFFAALVLEFQFSLPILGFPVAAPKTTTE
jgi:hypothetical protein